MIILKKDKQEKKASDLSKMKIKKSLFLVFDVAMDYIFIGLFVYFLLATFIIISYCFGFDIINIKNYVCFLGTNKHCCDLFLEYKYLTIISIFLVIIILWIVLIKLFFLFEFYLNGRNNRYQ